MEYLNRDELRRLFQVAYDNNRLQHLALVAGLWHGLRVSEIINIRGNDICDGQLSVRRLKKSKPTIHAIHKDADLLFDESPILDMAKANPYGKLFPFNRQQMDYLIKKYGELAGIHPDKRHMHVLKHSVAMLLWDTTHSLGTIQNYLGHKAASSTLCYLAEADSQKAQAAVAGISI